jgi:hypothetical protein
MRRKIGSRWIDYRQPIDLLDQPSNMEIRLYWYQNETRSMWTYDFMNHLMVELETIIALAIMISIMETNLHEWDPMDEWAFKDK